MLFRRIRGGSFLSRKDILFKVVISCFQISSIHFRAKSTKKNHF